MGEAMNIGRRDFLKVSSAAVATATFAPRLLADEAAPRRLVLGFARLEEPLRIADATTLGSGDGAFITRGARVSLSGLAGVREGAVARSVELLVHYSYLDGAERREAPFVAWACDPATGSQGNAVSFNVPVDESQRISLSVRTQRSVPKSGVAKSRRRAVGGPGEPLNESHPVALSLLSEEGTKLQRGYYVIVPLFDGDSEPHWSSYGVAMVDGRRALVADLDTPAAFEHFVIKIDYAAE